MITYSSLYFTVVDEIVYATARYMSLTSTMPNTLNLIVAINIITYNQTINSHVELLVKHYNDSIKFMNMNYCGFEAGCCCEFVKQCC